MKTNTHPMCDSRINLLHRLTQQSVQQFVVKIATSQSSRIEHNIRNANNFLNVWPIMNTVTGRDFRTFYQEREKMFVRKNDYLHQSPINSWVTETECGCWEFARYSSVDIFIIVARETMRMDIQTESFHCFDALNGIKINWKSLIHVWKMARAFRTNQ